MDQEGAELIVTWYLELESRLLSILRTVSYSDDKKSIWLPPLANIVVDTCSLIDTVFREEYKGSKKNKDANIVDYRAFFEPALVLSQIRTLVYQYPPSFVVPFSAWGETASESRVELTWWDSYNKLKHNRIQYQ
ncbi:MAG: hypothetical protein L0287_32890 [Anaerolineae bacterium]|nr:hypothetical protein [Anaerolineae bacterium]